MGHPEITADQREMAVVMLANAIRKDAHLRDRAHRAGEHGLLQASLSQRRVEPSQRYIDGMRDLLRVLFLDGQAVVEECLEEAYARAIGAPAPAANNSNGTHYH
jgi:hypothetical protein